MSIGSQFFFPCFFFLWNTHQRKMIFFWKRVKKIHLAWLKNTLSVFIVRVLFRILCVCEVNCTFYTHTFPVCFKSHFELVSLLLGMTERLTLSGGFLSSWITAASCISNFLVPPHPSYHSSGKEWCCKFVYLTPIVAELWFCSSIHETVVVDRKRDDKTCTRQPMNRRINIDC